MNSIEASTQIYNTRFIGRICFFAVTGQRDGRLVVWDGCWRFASYCPATRLLSQQLLT
ncbi:MAG TPA: hypothetical protein PLR25_06840 [Planctomycetaceae bacterium]|nr:hypothetical protein [Planctomycetaceae bacterium]